MKWLLPSALSPANKNFSWASLDKMISSALPPSTKDAARQEVTRMTWAVHSQRAEVWPCRHLLFLTTTPVLRKEHQKMAKKRIVCGFATKSTDLAFAECCDEDNALYTHWPWSPPMIKGPESLLDGSRGKSLNVTIIFGNSELQHSINLPQILC